MHMHSPPRIAASQAVIWVRKEACGAVVREKEEFETNNALKKGRKGN
jgi:hypothetical protein